MIRRRHVRRATVAAVAAVAMALTGAPGIAAAAPVVDCTPRPGADLHGCVYEGRDLTGVSFAGSNLARSRFVDSDLTGADLTGTTLTGVQSARLVGRPSRLPTGWRLTLGVLVGRGANLRNADLRRANLRSLDLTGADFTASHLEGANLTGAVLDRAVLDRAWTDHTVLSWTRADGLQARGVRGAAAALAARWTQQFGMLLGPRVDLGSVDLSSLPLGPVDLTGARLTGAGLRNTDLVGAQLADADLRDVVGTGVNLQQADLTGADLSGAALGDANLVAARLSHAVLRATDLSGVVVSHAALDGVDLGDAVLDGVASGDVRGDPAVLPPSWSMANGYLVGPGAALGGADLVGAQLTNADLSGSTLANADLSGSAASGIDLRQSDLTDADLTGSDLRSGSFDGAQVDASAFAGSVLTGAVGNSLEGAPSSLPPNWAVANKSLSSIPTQLTAGQWFDHGQWIQSANGQFTVVMQDDGNLVEYQGGTAIWATGTGGDNRAVMQTDCNMVVYAANGVATYSTGTGGGGDGCTFRVELDGSLQVTMPTGTVRWARHADGTIYTHRILMAQNAPVYQGTNTGTAQIGTIPQGQAPQYVCWTRGQVVGRVDVWFYVLWAGAAGYYPSYYDDSRYSWDERISIDYGVPGCGSVPTTFTPPSNGTQVPPAPGTISAAIALTSDTYLRSGPSTSEAALTLMPRGTRPGFVCWTTGPPVNAVDVWFKVVWSGTTGFYPSGLDDSHYTFDAQITGKYGIPSCSGGSGVVVTPPRPPAPPAGSPGSTIWSSDPSAPYAYIRSGPSTASAAVVDDGGWDTRWNNGHPVAMLCWQDNNGRGGWAEANGRRSNRWFAVAWRMGSYHMIYAWVFSNLVKDQTRVPNCSDASMNTLRAYIVPAYYP